MTLASVAARAGSEGGGDLREASDVSIAADEMMRVTCTPKKELIPDKWEKRVCHIWEKGGGGRK